MRKYLALCLTVLLPGLIARGFGFAQDAGLAVEAQKPDQIEVIDMIVAIVDKDGLILLSDLKSAYFETTQQVYPMSHLTDSDGKVIARVLQDLIDSELVMTLARAKGIAISPSELDEEIKKHLDSSHMTWDKLRETLKENNITLEQYKQAALRQLTKYRFQGQVIRPLCTITEAELVDSYFKSHPRRDQSGKKMVNLISVSKPDEIAADAQDKYTEVLGKITSQVNDKVPFSKIAQNFKSMQDQELSIAVLPPRNLDELPEAIQLAFEGKDVGDRIGPVDMGSSVYFAEDVGFEVLLQSDFKEKRPEIEANLLGTKIEKAFNEYIETQRKTQRIVINDGPWTPFLN